MTAMQAQPRDAHRLDRIAAIVLGAVLTSCVLYVALRWRPIGANLFWDYRVYASAVEAFAAGLDPYRAGVIQRFGAAPGLNFTSPPAFLALMRGLDAAVGVRGLLALYVAVFVSLLAATTAAQLRLLVPGTPARQLSGDILAVFAAFNIAGLMTIITGNFGVLLNAAIALGIAHGVRTRRWWPLFVAIALCAAIKPFYLQFLAVPVLHEAVPLGAATLRRLAVAAGSVLAAAAIYAASWAMDPVRFAAWRTSLADQSFARGDMGANLFAWLVQDSGLRIAVLPAGALQLLFAGLLLGIVHRGLPRPNARRLAGLWLAAAFANPRLMMYDLAFVAIPATALLAGWAARRFGLSRHAAGGFACAALFGVGLLSTTDPIVPRSLTFPMVALLAVVLACRDERDDVRAPAAPVAAR